MNDTEILIALWLHDTNFYIDKVFHYTSLVEAPIFIVEDFEGQKNHNLYNFIKKLKRNLKDKDLFDNKIVAKIRITLPSEKNTTLYCGFKDNDFIIGLSVRNESVSEPTVL